MWPLTGERVNKAPACARRQGGVQSDSLILNVCVCVIVATVLARQNSWRKEASCWLVISETLTCDSLHW